MDEMRVLRLANILSKIARVWSLMSISFVLLSMVSEVFSPHSQLPKTQDMVGLAFFPVGVVVGVGLGWWREGLGGSIATTSLVGFYLWCYFVRGRLAGGPFFLAIAAPGIIFLAAWAVRRQFDIVNSAT